MNKLTYKEFKDFLESDVDEATYFCYNKEDLISLKERLEGLRERFEICESRIERDREKIIREYNNITDISYSDYRKTLTFNDGKSSYYLKKDEGKNRIIIDCDLFVNIEGILDIEIYYNPHTTILENNISKAKIYHIVTKKEV